MGGEGDDGFLRPFFSQRGTELYHDGSQPGCLYIVGLLLDDRETDHLV